MSDKKPFRGDRLNEPRTTEHFIAQPLTLTSTDGICTLATTESGAQLFAEIAQGRITRFIGRAANGADLVTYQRRTDSDEPMGGRKVQCWVFLKDEQGRTFCYEVPCEKVPPPTGGVFK